MGLCTAFDELGLLMTAGGFTMDDTDDSDTRRGFCKSSGKDRCNGRGACLHDAGTLAGFSPEQLPGFNAIPEDQDEGCEWGGEDELPEGSSAKGSVKGSAKGSAKGHQVLRQRGFGPEEEVYGDAFAHFQILMVRKWFPERVFGFW